MFARLFDWLLEREPPPKPKTRYYIKSDAVEDVINSWFDFVGSTSDREGAINKQRFKKVLTGNLVGHDTFPEGIWYFNLDKGGTPFIDREKKPK